MYIPTWLLVIVVAGVLYYFYTKRKSGQDTIPHSENKEAQDETNEDWLDSENWREIAIEHLSKFPQRTGRKRPTYEEILELDEDEFKAWLFVMAESENQDDTIKQMTEHETRTGSFGKTKREDDTPFTKLIVDVFDTEKSAEVVSTLRNLSTTANKLVDEGAEGEKGDIVKQSIWAKGVSDYYKLGEKMGQ